MTSMLDRMDAEREIATIRCLVAQQIQAIDRSDRDAPERQAADLLLRRLLHRDEVLMRRILDGAAGVPVR